MNILTTGIKDGWGAFPSGAVRRRWTEFTFLTLARFVGLAGDALYIFVVIRAALVLSASPAVAAPSAKVSAWLYVGLGVTIYVAAFAYNAIYSRELLLNRRKQTIRLIEAWLAASILFFGSTFLLGVGLISFYSSLLSAFCLLPLLLGWRLLLQKIMRYEFSIRLLRQRIIVLGWSAETARLACQTWENFTYPCEIIGYVEITADPDQGGLPPNIPCLGTKQDLAGILQSYEVDVAFLAGTDAPVDAVLELARICESEMVEFKVIPSCFPALASGMHIEWVSGVPILGTDRLQMNRLHVRIEKRSLDILGALVGLFLAGPIIGLFALIVHLESPGPVFYRQRRLGRKGRPFDLIKIRSMRLDAEQNGKPGWTVSDDPRRLKIGAFMRRWNIDELPQFWNVLKGEMSLVGPRPERPEFIADLKHEIIHYNLRHSVKPGLTGWAQVNGLRGNTDLSERIRLDLFYIDNWSLLLDVQTMFLTFFKRENAC